MLAHVATQYAEFLENFTALYSDVSIRPKMHFLVHYPTIIRKNGAPKNFSVLNYERMNGAVKKPAHTMNNFRNPPKTLAYKSQCSAWHAQLNKEMLCESITFGLLFQCTRRDLPANIPNLYQEKPTITIFYKMSLNNTHYWKEVFVVLKASTTPSKGLVFGEIGCVICEEETSPLFVLTLYTTVEFCNDSFCYVIERKKT